MNQPPPAPARTHVIACATVIEEMLPLMPTEISYQVLEFGLHAYPDQLRTALQKAIDAAPAPADTVVLGYGLCSQAVAGLRANGCQLVIPRVDDCIAIFLGSRQAYTQQLFAEPGTYYVTKGWLEVGELPFGEYEKLVERHGAARAERLIRLLLHNYTRLAFINTGQYALDHYRERAQEIAARFDLRYEEIPGSADLVERMLFGPWDESFVVVPPGDVLQQEDFFDPSVVRR